MSFASPDLEHVSNEDFAALAKNLRIFGVCLLVGAFVFGGWVAAIQQRITSLETKEVSRDADHDKITTIYEWVQEQKRK